MQIKLQLKSSVNKYLLEGEKNTFIIYWWINLDIEILSE